METPSECQSACKLFYIYQSDALQKSKNYVFDQSYHLKDDEHRGNKLGIKEVLGEDYEKNFKLLISI